jgi:hypothetical protein
MRNPRTTNWGFHPCHPVWIVSISTAASSSRPSIAAMSRRCDSTCGYSTKRTTSSNRQNIAIAVTMVSPAMRPNRDVRARRVAADGASGLGGIMAEPVTASGRRIEDCRAVRRAAPIGSPGRPEAARSCAGTYAFARERGDVANALHALVPRPPAFWNPRADANSPQRFRFPLAFLSQVNGVFLKAELVRPLVNTRKPAAQIGRNRRGRFVRVTLP